MVALFVFFYKLRRMNLVSRFPGVIAFWVALPLKEILKGFLSPMIPMFSDGLDLVFGLPINQVRWGPRVVGAVRGGFDIRG